MGIECSCSMDVDWCVGDFTHKRMVKARKSYVCVECGEAIKYGDVYETMSGRSDGHFWSARTCLTCSRIRESYCPHGFVVGWLREHLRACLGIDYVTGEIDEIDGEEA